MVEKLGDSEQTWEQESVPKGNSMWSARLASAGKWRTVMTYFFGDLVRICNMKTVFMSPENHCTNNHDNSEDDDQNQNCD